MEAIEATQREPGKRLSRENSQPLIPPDKPPKTEAKSEQEDENGPEVVSEVSQLKVLLVEGLSRKKPANVR